MKKLLFLALIITLVGCKSQNGYFEKCDLEKELFIDSYNITLCLDTVKNYKEFKRISKVLADTLSDCIYNYAFIYDYENHSFTPNRVSEKNISIGGFEIINCSIYRHRPILSIYILNQDTVVFTTKNEAWYNDTTSGITKRRSTILKINDNQDAIGKYLDSFYLDYLNNFSEDSDHYNWIYLCIREDVDFKKNLLPIFNSLFNRYYYNTVKSINAKFNSSICFQDSITRNHMIEDYGFILIINDFDPRIKLWELTRNK